MYDPVSRHREQLARDMEDEVRNLHRYLAEGNQTQDKKFTGCLLFALATVVGLCYCAYCIMHKLTYPWVWPWPWE